MNSTVRSLTRTAQDVATAGAGAIRRAVGADKTSLAARHDDPTQWRSVTIFASNDAVVVNGKVVGAVGELGDALEVQTRPAPRERGTELSVRARPESVDSLQTADDDPADAIRAALRQTKQLIETGEILLRDPQPEGDRPNTPIGKLLDQTVHRAGSEGVL